MGLQVCIIHFIDPFAGKRTNMEETKPDPIAELAFMKAIAEGAKGLDDATIRRVLRWALEALVAPQAVGSTVGNPTITSAAPDAARTAAAERPQYATLADFFSSCNPATDTEKALVVGYWAQVKEGSPEFDAQSINKELKHMGHGVANITSAFDNLIARKPQFVIQTRKSGNTKQARKLYKLTTEGIRTVERMVGAEE
jgi:hypothetical protein